jgi:flagellar hook protein FlgE
MDSTLTAAVSGLLAQSTAIANVSANLANSETTGYKAVATTFDSLVTSNTGSAATTVTSGVSAQTRQDVTEQGTIAATTTSTDIAIDGNGMFAVTEGATGTGTYYTRDGAFDTDSSGNLYLSGTDYYLQGYPTDSSGNATSSTLQTINLSQASTAATATTKYSLSANLPAEEQSSVYSQSYTTDDTGATEGVTYSYSTLSTDSSGNTTYQLAVSASNSSATLTDDDGTTSTAGQPLLYDVTVDSSGTITSVTNAQTGQATSVSPSLPSVTPSDSTDTVAAPASWSDIGSSTALAQSITVYDSLGTAQTLPVTWTAEGNNQWLMTVSSPTDAAGASSGSLTDSTGATVSSYSYQVTFNSDGSLGSVVGLPTSTGGTAPMAGTDEPALSATWSDGATASNVTLDLGTSGSTAGLSQYDSGETTASVDVKSSSQDGVAYGTLSSVAVNSSGEVMATYTNGNSVPIYKIPVATFANEDGLTALSDNVYQASATSGTAILNTAGTNGAGTLEGGALESSTTDTTTEFSTMIAAQQAYSASSQAISVDRSDFSTLMQSVS